MTWLHYLDDEVSRFHPEFERVARAALADARLSARFHWEHHPRTAGVQVVPDFVLVETRTNRWWLIVEIKRSRASVFSERNQIQAKGYAEANRTLYPPGRAQYFAVSNLEATLLFAANPGVSVRECRIADMAFDSGSFTRTNRETHQRQLQADLAAMLLLVSDIPTPLFDLVWPRLARDMLSRARAIEFSSVLDLSSAALPDIVRNYFAGGEVEVAPRELLLRCLLTEYLKGILRRVNHGGLNLLPVLRADIRTCGNGIDALRTIDFSGLFEAGAGDLYRNLGTMPTIRVQVEQYLAELLHERVVELALRSDALDLPESLLYEAYTHQVRPDRGKAHTDPDLASLLATLTIARENSVVLDPGCGDGALLGSAYDYFRNRARTHADAMSQLRGLEADAFTAKIAALRLVLRDPYSVASTDPCHVIVADMFSSPTAFDKVDVILMNPPFKRYEAQDEAPLPPELRTHICNSIQSLGGTVLTDERQANLYNLYVEYVVKASMVGTRFGFILDNRWFHKSASAVLRNFLLNTCALEAVVRYPHDQFFEGFTIATTMLVASKGRPLPGHVVRFVRTNDPRASDFGAVADALRGNGEFPTGWEARTVLQSTLDGQSWQSHFSALLPSDVFQGWPTLNVLFSSRRRGSLAKEGGGIAVYEFPFGRTNYGPQRFRRTGNRIPFQTEQGRVLTREENSQIRDAATLIPQAYRGYAVNNSDTIAGYRLTIEDVSRDMTLEAPSQRTAAARILYTSNRRRRWDASMDILVNALRTEAGISPYIELIEAVVGLRDDVLTTAELWNVLREPIAGELIIPRKLRRGHRVHINTFAFQANSRQVRLSSNFLSYSGCTALDSPSGLSRETSTLLIAAFLMSSFGQFQFEMHAHNREGVRSIEQEQLERIRIFDPRWIRPEHRADILGAFAALPFPVQTDVHPLTQVPLTRLDSLFAAEIAARDPVWLGQEEVLLRCVWDGLFEWLEARRP